MTRPRGSPAASATVADTTGPPKRRMTSNTPPTSGSANADSAA